MAVHGDEFGFLWDDSLTLGQSSHKGKGRPKAAPPKPDWDVPTEFPSFKDRPRIAIDIETFDPDLKTKGPGVRRDGYICGVALGLGPNVEDALYYPVAHKGPNLDKAKVYGWLAEEAAEFRGELVGANLNYDLDFLAEGGVHFPHAQIRDVQIAEPLIDELQRSYALQRLAETHLGEKKITDELAQLYGDDYISRMPDIWSGHAALYAAGDVSLPWRILDKQLAIIKKEKLERIFDIESRLPPLLLHMRRVGVRVDIDKAQKVSEELAQRFTRGLDELPQHADIWAAESLARLFDAEGIEYLRTEKTGKPSFKKEWLEACTHPLAQQIVELRKLDKLKGTFIDGYILDSHINGRLHCQFNQLRSDEGGTVSGRFSSCLPGYMPISTEHGDVLLSDIKPGVKVWTHKGNLKEVKNLWFNGNEKTYRISLDNGRYVDCTSNHRILTDQGWLSLEDIYGLGPDDFAAYCGNISQRGETNDTKNGTDSRNTRMESTGDASKRTAPGTIQKREGATLREVEVRLSQRYDEQIQGSASQLQRGSERWERLPSGIAPEMVHGESNAKPRISASRSDVRSARHNRDTETISCTSREQPNRGQQATKPCVGVACGSQSDPQVFSNIRKVEPLGVAPVYDLEVETDHCYLANGVFVHNSGPNLQNIPARDPWLGPLIRSMFIPEEGMMWGAADWSQIEFRFLVHWAMAAGLRTARAAADMYINDPTTDFHAMAAELTMLERGPSKNINFGVVYGMGVGLMARSLNLPMDEAQEILETFHTRLPFIKQIYDLASNRARQKRYITTILGRRRRFPGGEFTHKALNGLLQGSAADLMKKAMIDMWDAGIFGEGLLVPHLTVHDEMDVSIPQTKAGREAFDELVNIMQTSMQLEVPVLADALIGNNWSECK